MRRILTYKLFEGTPFTRENIQKSIREKINEKEVESVITDMCADFMDEYNVAIHFNWGWVVDPNQIHGLKDFRRDTEINIIRSYHTKKWPSGDTKDKDQMRQEYLKEVDRSSTRR